jgi:hypothetical protein
MCSFCSVKHAARQHPAKKLFPCQQYKALQTRMIQGSLRTLPPQFASFAAANCEIGEPLYRRARVSIHLQRCG